MDSRQLKNLVERLEALKTPDTSDDYQAGVDAAKELINSVVQQALDRERIQKLESELTELRAKYPEATPKRRGRKPKAVQTQATQPQQPE
jgi:hypothetical protein